MGKCRQKNPEKFWSFFLSVHFHSWYLPKISCPLLHTCVCPGPVYGESAVRRDDLVLQRTALLLQPDLQCGVPPAPPALLHPVLLPPPGRPQRRQHRRLHRNTVAAAVQLIKMLLVLHAIENITCMPAPQPRGRGGAVSSSPASESVSLQAGESGENSADISPCTVQCTAFSIMSNWKTTPWFLKKIVRISYILFRNFSFAATL